MKNRICVICDPLPRKGKFAARDGVDQHAGRTRYPEKSFGSSRHASVGGGARRFVVASIKRLTSRQSDAEQAGFRLGRA